MNWKKFLLVGVILGVFLLQGSNTSSAQGQEIAEVDESPLIIIADILRPVEELTANLVDDGSILVSWEPTQDDRVEGYQLLRGTDPQSLELVVELPLDTRYFADSELESGETYFYRVDSVAEGFDPTSSEVIAITLQQDDSSLPFAQQIDGDNRDPYRFWVVLFLLNLVAWGMLLVAYYIVSRVLGRGRKSDFKLSARLDAKTGNPDVDVNKLAQQRYADKNKQKLQEWEKFSEEL